ncbi:TPA: hypothetical protein DCY43_01605 [candidate division WWE3 bacterium]|uniref:YgjP-like metallopeptidase domain-containing protein n=1 Tax=candidate division WWE3 bacterium TaxID=2053526 RepID=A0A351JT13_UNCKA|nr:hypothetical protein [candidate division WWE3 bacterium]
MKRQTERFFCTYASVYQKTVVCQKTGIIICVTQSLFIRLLKFRRKSPKDYLRCKEAARDLVLTRLNYFNSFYSFTWNRIAIKNTTRRWGSCSKKRNLNFCYKVVLLDPGLADYIIVHELCHLGQFNHSAKYWELVARAIPDYKKQRLQLKAMSISRRYS